MSGGCWAFHWLGHATGTWSNCGDQNDSQDDSADSGCEVEYDWSEIE